MARKTGVVRGGKGQKPIRFQEGALTASAKRHGYSSAKAYCSSGTAKGTDARRCSFMANVLTGPKKGK